MAPLRNGAIHQAEMHQATMKPKNRPGPARPGHVNITPVITAVDFGQTLTTFNLGCRFPFSKSEVAVIGNKKTAL